MTRFENEQYQNKQKKNELDQFLASVRHLGSVCLIVRGLNNFTCNLERITFWLRELRYTIYFILLISSREDAAVIDLCWCACDYHVFSLSSDESLTSNSTKIELSRQSWARKQGTKVTDDGVGVLDGPLARRWTDTTYALLRDQSTNGSLHYTRPLSCQPLPLRYIVRQHSWSYGPCPSFGAFILTLLIFSLSHLRCMPVPLWIHFDIHVCCSYKITKPPHVNGYSPWFVDVERL